MCIFHISPSLPRRARNFPRGYFTVPWIHKNVGKQTMSLSHDWITFGRLALRELAAIRFCRKNERNARAEGRTLISKINNNNNIYSHKVIKFISWSQVEFFKLHHTLKGSGEAYKDGRTKSDMLIPLALGLVAGSRIAAWWWLRRLSDTCWSSNGYSRGAAHRCSLLAHNGHCNSVREGLHISCNVNNTRVGGACSHGCSDQLKDRSRALHVTITHVKRCAHAF